MTPFNRYILIDPMLDENCSSDSSILIPENYREIPPYISAKVIDFAEDCKINVKKEQLIVIDSSMVQEIEINREINFLILENYVIGAIEEG
jgi:hypothetical protein